MAESPTGVSFESVGKALATVLGVCYATGFLVIYTFLDRFHVREHGSEILRLKYIYVGIMCLLFPCAVLLPGWALFILFKNLEESKLWEELKFRSPHPERPVVQLRQAFLAFVKSANPRTKDDVEMDGLSVMLGVFVPSLVYMAVQFARPTQKPNITATTILVVCNFVALILIDLCKKTFGPIVVRVIRLGCLVLAMGAVYIWDWSFIEYVFRNIVWSGGWLYLLLMTTAAVVLIRCWHSAEALKEPDRRPLWIVGLSLSIALAYIAILSYGAWVYPFIPATRGGGDFTTVSSVTLRLSEKASELVLPCRLSAMCKAETMQFKVIDATSESLLLAYAGPGEDVCSWRNLPSTSQDEARVPLMYEVSKSDIISLTYLPLVWTDCSADQKPEQKTPNTTPATTAKPH